MEENPVSGSPLCFLLVVYLQGVGALRKHLGGGLLRQLGHVFFFFPSTL